MSTVAKLGWVIVPAGIGLASWFIGYGFKDGWSQSLVDGLFLAVATALGGFLLAYRGDEWTKKHKEKKNGDPFQYYR
jgi:hypothetical protein